MVHIPPAWASTATKPNTRNRKYDFASMQVGELRKIDNPTATFASFKLHAASQARKLGMTILTHQNEKGGFEYYRSA